MRSISNVVRKRPNAFYLYLYVDPQSGDRIYVGKGHGKRALSHLQNSTDSNSRLKRLISKRKKQGYTSIPTILVLGTESYILELEVKYIRAIGRADIGTGTLFNNTDGGDGVANPPDEVREAQANAMYRRFGGKIEHDFVKPSSGEIFHGTAVAFAKHLKIKQGAIRKLFQESSDVMSVKGWKLVGTDVDPIDYGKSIHITHMLNGDTQSGSIAELSKAIGVNYAHLHRVASGDLPHAKKWILTETKHSYQVPKHILEGKHHYANLPPWENLNATDTSRSLWAIADKIKHRWDELSLGRTQLARSLGFELNDSPGAWTNLVIRFKNGWNPNEDDEWAKFRETYETKYRLPKIKYIGTYDNRKILPWNHHATTRFSNQIWRKAQDLRDVWETEQCGGKKLARLAGMRYGKAITTMVDRFRNYDEFGQEGWVPNKDPDWLKFFSQGNQR